MKKYDFTAADYKFMYEHHDTLVLARHFVTGEILGIFADTAEFEATFPGATIHDEIDDYGGRCVWITPDSKPLSKSKFIKRVMSWGVARNVAKSLASYVHDQNRYFSDLHDKLDTATADLLAKEILDYSRRHRRVTEREAWLFFQSGDTPAVIYWPEDADAWDVFNGNVKYEY